MELPPAGADSQPLRADVTEPYQWREPAADMEVFLARFYSEDATRDDEKAAHFSGLALFTAGAMLEPVEHEMIEIRFTSLCRSRRYHEANDFIESAIRRAPPNTTWRNTLEKWWKGLNEIMTDSTKTTHSP